MPGNPGRSPLAAAGMSLALGRGDLASGATLLFATNLLAIILTAALTSEAKPGPYLVHFDVHKTDDTAMAFVVARFNAEKYAALQDQLKRVNPMAGTTLDNARITVALNNDERSPTTVYSSIGTFADGNPVDGNYEVKLEPRQEIGVKLGDVKMAFLAKWGWAGIANVRTEIPVQ